MNSSARPKSLVKQIGQIKHMERGKLCLLREGPNGPYYTHQTWQDGKNVCRYVPQEQLRAVKEALAGYEKIRHLTEECWPTR